MSSTPPRQAARPHDAAPNLDFLVGLRRPVSICATSSSSGVHGPSRQRCEHLRESPYLLLDPLLLATATIDAELCCHRYALRHSYSTATAQPSTPTWSWSSAGADHTAALLISVMKRQTRAPRAPAMAYRRYSPHLCPPPTFLPARPCTPAITRHCVLLTVIAARPRPDSSRPRPARHSSRARRGPGRAHQGRCCPGPRPYSSVQLPLRSRPRPRAPGLAHARLLPRPPLLCCRCTAASYCSWY